MRAEDLRTVRLCLEAERGQHEDSSRALDAVELRLLGIYIGERLSMVESYEKHVIEAEKDATEIAERLGVGDMDW